MTLMYDIVSYEVFLYVSMHIVYNVANSYIMGTKDVWHLLHRRMRA